jgi:predicted lipoprotein with Yx(FWY)xxD motif
MMFLKRSTFAALLPLLLVGMLAIACGNASTTTGSSAPTATSAPTPTPTTASAPVVMTASATVGGKSVTILTDTKGMTLYYFKKDTATASNCTGGCAQFWPPLLFKGTGTPSASTSLPGTLSVVNTANGPQVAYQGHLLYTFQKDTAPGQINGQGFNGVWFVATTDLPPMSGGSGGGATTPTPTSNGY